MSRSMSVSTTGIASGGFDVKLTTTTPLSPLSIEAPVSLGAGDLTLKINGDVSQTSSGGITAAGLQILGSGTVRLDSATKSEAHTADHQSLRHILSGALLVRKRNV